MLEYTCQYSDRLSSEHVIEHFLKIISGDDRSGSHYTDYESLTEQIPITSPLSHMSQCYLHGYRKYVQSISALEEAFEP